MKRLIAAAVVAVLIIGLMIFGFVFDTGMISQVEDKISTAAELNSRDDQEGARLALEQARNIWNDKSRILLIFLSHKTPDQVEESLNIAKTYIERGESVMFEAECKRLGTLLDHLYKLEYPTFTNIF